MMIYVKPFSFLAIVIVFFFFTKIFNPLNAIKCFISENLHMIRRDLNKSFVSFLKIEVMIVSLSQNT